MRRLILNGKRYFKLSHFIEVITSLYRKCDKRACTFYMEIHCQMWINTTCSFQKKKATRSNLSWIESNERTGRTEVRIIDIKMMESWKKVSLLLCIFGFLREMRPSEPFAVEFFINFANVTNTELTNFYFPLGTYSYMVQLVLLFLITDLLR